MIRVAANASKDRLKEMSLVWLSLSASKPLGTEKTREKARGIATATLAMKIDNSYSLIRTGKRARGRFV